MNKDEILKLLDEWSAKRDAEKQIKADAEATKELNDRLLKLEAENKELQEIKTKYESITKELTTDNNDSPKTIDDDKIKSVYEKINL